MHRFPSNVSTRLLTLFFMVGLASLPVAYSAAQEQTAAPESAAATNETTATGPAATAFNEVFSQWKTKLGALRETQLKYSLAEEPELQNVEYFLPSQEDHFVSNSTVNLSLVRRG